MTGDISLRTAHAADYDGIIAVVDDWWGRPVHRALPRLFLDHFHDTSFIAERSGGELAGFLELFRSRLTSRLDQSHCRAENTGAVK
jgi:hypothetical protein